MKEIMHSKRHSNGEEFKCDIFLKISIDKSGLTEEYVQDAYGLHSSADTIQIRQPNSCQIYCIYFQISCKTLGWILHACN